jgi:hypothetical protein
MAASAAELKEAVKGLSAKEREALLQDLQQPEPRKKIPLDVSEARSEFFIADLKVDERIKDASYAGQRAVWFKGNDNAKGPKSGVYLYGRVAVGPKGHTRNGMMKISSASFNVFKSGGECDAWVRFDGEKSDQLIGVMVNYREAGVKSTAQ